MNELSLWLDGAAVRVFALSATLFVVLNAAAVALVFVKRDRGLVNRWTARWLAANLVLIGAGTGVPIAAKLVHLTVDALSASRGLSAPNEREPDGEKPPRP